MAHLIGIYSAEQGEGKTTVANRFRGRADAVCRVLSFTDLVDNFVEPLVAETFGLGRLDTNYENTPIPQLKGITPERMKQTLITEWGENCVHPDLWVKIAEGRINQAMQAGHIKYVIVDGINRDNEFEMIKRLGGELWRVDRFNPDYAGRHFIGEDAKLVITSIDRVIRNKGSIDELRNKVDRIIKKMEFFKKYKPGDAIPIHVCNENIRLYVKKEGDKCYWSSCFVRHDGRKQWEEISRELFDALLQREIYKEES